MFRNNHDDTEFHFQQPNSFKKLDYFVSDDKKNSKAKI